MYILVTCAGITQGWLCVVNSIIELGLSVVDMVLEIVDMVNFGGILNLVSWVA